MVLIQILRKTCIVLSIRFCGSVEELHAVQQGISHFPLLPATVLVHGHELQTLVLDLVVVITRPVCELPWPPLVAQSKS